MNERICSVEGCERKHHGKGLCKFHRKRQLNGLPLEAPMLRVAKHTEKCAVEGCERVRRKRQWCAAHYRRVRLDIPLDAPWKGEEPGYSVVHKRLGSAKDEPCSDCGGQASQWSYVHGCEDERIFVTAKGAYPYCLHRDHYEPRCVPCHVRYDAARSTAEFRT